MTQKLSLITLITAITLAAPLTSAAQTQDLPPGVATSFQSQRPGDRSEDMYAAGKKAVYESQWQAALDDFRQVVKAGRTHVDEALYWQAYSQNKLGQRGEALTSIGQLKREFPRSQWIKDASALEIEIQQASGQQAKPEEQADCELKVLAVNSLLNNDPDRAIPILEKLLSGNNAQGCHGQILDKALFVLSQSDSSRARDLMQQIASGKTHPELQMKAIHYIGISGNHAELMQIYNSTSNLEAKKAVLHSFGISGGCSELLAASRNEKEPQLVREAIHSMGIAGCRQQMRDLYSNSMSPELKSDILHATIVSGDTELQEKVATGDGDPKLRTEAIRNMGISGGSSATLVKIYQNDPSTEVKEAVMNALFIKGDAHSLVDLSRRETNPELRKRLVQKLSIMNNREATDYLMEVLNK